MNLDRALILLLASVSAVSGFAPGFTSRQTSRVVSGSTLFSDEAAVSTDAETPAAAVEEPQSTYDTQIYVGNISFDTVEGICPRNKFIYVMLYLKLFDKHEDIPF